MTETTVVSLPLRGGAEDLLTGDLQQGARETARHAAEAGPAGPGDGV